MSQRVHESSNLKKKKLPKAREKASDEVATGYTFESDRWRGWREFSGPITRAK